jgi:hypothetical protein
MISIFLSALAITQLNNGFNDQVVKLAKTTVERTVNDSRFTDLKYKLEKRGGFQDDFEWMKDKQVELKTAVQSFGASKTNDIALILAGCILQAIYLEKPIRAICGPILLKSASYGTVRVTSSQSLKVQIDGPGGSAEGLTDIIWVRMAGSGTHTVRDTESNTSRAVKVQKGKEALIQF